jgi:SNF2 family DNA or RNA helicase
MSSLSTENSSMNTDNPSNIFKLELEDDNSYFGNSIFRQVCELIKKGNINPDGKLATTPPEIKLPLKLHQQRVVAEMLDKETMKYRVSNSINMFILADKVGSGKSIDILSLIAHRPEVQVNPIPNKIIYRPEKYSRFSGYLTENNVVFKTNMIVIPHGIYNQWSGYIKDNTTLTYYGISFNRDIDKLDLNDLIQGKYNILLVKSTRYNNLMDKIYYKYSEDSEQVKFSSTISGLTNLVPITDHFYNIYNQLRNNNFHGNFVNNLDELTQKLVSLDLSEIKNAVKEFGKYKIDYIKKYKGPLFERVIFDEANSIRMPNCRYAYGKINWFVTSSVDDLLCPWGKRDYYNNKIIIKGITGKGFIKNSLGENSGRNKSNFLQDIYIKNSDKFVEDSFGLPDPITNMIECYTPPELKALQGIGLPEVVQALNAGDVESAISQVGCSVKSEEGIIDAVLYKLNSELSNKQLILTDKNKSLEIIEKEIEILVKLKKEQEESLKIFENTLSSSADTEAEIIMNMSELEKSIISLTETVHAKRSIRSSYKNSIKNFTEQVKNLNFKLESLKSRISNVDEKDCPVCAQKVTNPAMTPCCKNIFCFQCMAMALNYSQNKECPLCRKKVDISQMTAIKSGVVENNDNDETKLPIKIDCLINLIKSKPEGRFLVFSEYDNSFIKVSNTLNESNIRWSKLCGSSGHITNVINHYTDNQIKVLLLNAKHYGSGLNLQMTTDIVLYHRMSEDLEKQVIGRGQRLGRTSTLNVHYLCYENEL